MNVFISGKITGNPDYKKQFHQRAVDLRSLGHFPYDPCVIGENLKEELGREPTYEEYMERDFEMIDRVDAINFLPNWQDSEGSKREYEYAVAHNKIILQIKMFDWHHHSDYKVKR